MASFFDMFAGCGGFRVALERLGWKCVGSAEIDKFARKTYEANFDTVGEFYWPDAKTLETSTIPDFDVLTAGFPCQSFSRSGKQRGFDDARGTLFFEAARIIRNRRPRAFVMENVEGLLSNDERRTFTTMLRILAADVNGQETVHRAPDCLGYHVYWKVLNSRDFGVPQNRRRVFLCGFRERPAHFEFPAGRPLTVTLKDVLEKEIPEKYYLSERLIRTLLDHMERHGLRGHGFGMQVPGPDGVSGTIRAGYWRMGGSDTYVVQIHRYHKDGKHETRVFENVVPTIQGNAGGHNVPIVEDPLFVAVNQRREVRTSPIAGSLTAAQSATQFQGVYDYYNKRPRADQAVAGAVKGEGVSKTAVSTVIGSLSKGRLRRLTPRETARLQGFADTFLLPCSDKQSYKQIGNAVSVPVVYAIGQKISEVIR